MSEDYTLLPGDRTIPDGADFCIVMDSDCMEPYLHEGEKVFVSCSSPAELEIGLFRYMGKVYIRQWCEDYAGTLHLLCSNPKREDMNLTIGRDKKNRCLCLGRVLYAGKLSMPIYSPGK